MKQGVLLTRPSVCLVPSTLPAAFIKANAQRLNIRTVYVLGNNLYGSYQKAFEDQQEIQIKQLPATTLLRLLKFACVLIGLKLTGKQLVFFHECCLPTLDVLIYFFRPHGLFVPHVKMDSWQQIPAAQFPKSSTFTLLQRLGLLGLFDLRTSPPVGELPREYAMVMRRYPSQIQQEEHQIVCDQRYSQTGLNSKNVLLLLGKSCCSDSQQIMLMNQIVEIGLPLGYRFYVKNHPNPLYRVEFQHSSVSEIDPLLPSEFIQQTFQLVIGVSSTGLLNYGARAISLVHLLNMSADDLNFCLQHYELTQPGHSIQFPQDWASLKQLIVTIVNTGLNLSAA